MSDHDEITMTREEWLRLERREACDPNHRPSFHIGTFANPAGVWTCDCGDVVWKPTRKEEADG